MRSVVRLALGAQRIQFVGFVALAAHFSSWVYEGEQRVSFWCTAR